MGVRGETGFELCFLIDLAFLLILTLVMVERRDFYFVGNDYSFIRALIPTAILSLRKLCNFGKKARTMYLSLAVGSSRTACLLNTKPSRILNVMSRDRVVD